MASFKVTMSTEEIIPELLNFNEALDEIEQDNANRLKELPTKTPMETLIEFIGGFENWSLLNEDCRMEVVKYLDYKERCRLGLCSKQDYATVEKTPIFVYKLEIKDNNVIDLMYFMEDFEHVNVVIRLDNDWYSGERIELNFSQEGEDTRIIWLKPIPRKKPEVRQVTWKKCNYYETAIKFAEMWMKKCKFELIGLEVTMESYPFETSKIRKLPNCRYLLVGADHMEKVDWWLQKLPEQLQSLCLPNFSNTSPEFWNRPMITQVASFISCRAELTDEQFLRLKASCISIDSKNITEQGINEFLKQYVNGKRKNGLKETIFWADRDWNKDTIIEGLKVQPWDDDFEIEENAFCGDFRRICGRGTMYQVKSLIDPLESITLQVNYDRVGMFGTGKRVTNDGKTYTDYSIPI